MSKTWKIVSFIPVVVGLFVAEQHLKSGFHTPPCQERNLALGEAHARELLLLMAAGRNGKVSRQEFMAFMDAEFNRLGKNALRELDVKALTQPQLAVSAKAASR